MLFCNVQILIIKVSHFYNETLFIFIIKSNLLLLTENKNYDTGN